MMFKSKYIVTVGCMFLRSEFAGYSGFRDDWERPCVNIYLKSGQTMTLTLKDDSQIERCLGKLIADIYGETYNEDTFK